MNGIKYALIFVAGVVIGSASAILIVKDKYETIARNEIESIRKYYKEKTQKKEEPKEERYEELINNNGYVSKEENVEEVQNQPVEEEFDDRYAAPFIIDLEEYGENPSYDTMTLTYFADGVLVDDVDDLIEHPDSVVGLDNLKIFEEYDGCRTIYVRNDLWKMDFEVIKDDWNWSDIQEGEEKLAEKFKKPHQL